jgi:pyridinium-3,5-bisthiocarboxylic acid mononucleotide nickel chelatase
MKDSLRGLHVHFDPASGIAGDMTVAALVDAGVPAQVISRAVAEMGVKGLKVGFEKRKRGAFAGKGFLVSWPGKREEHEGGHDHGHPLRGLRDGQTTPPAPVRFADARRGHDHDHDDGHREHHHRDYGEIRRLLRKAGLDAETKRVAGEIFERIAHAEAELHGTTIDRVAFHEVGAWDSIADVVGAAAAISWLQPCSVSSTPPVLGSGVIHTAHGLMPVPAPATAAILHGIPTSSEGKGELTTPTGAAILASLVGKFGPPPPVRLRAQGFGAGTREIPDRANVLRVLLGEPLGQALPDSAPQVVLCEANLDDMSPQLIDPLITALFAAGAVDAWTTPIQMKKGRPAWQVSALAPPDAVAAVEQAFFLNSTTLGVRRASMERSVLSRSLAQVKTRFGAVTIKVAADASGVLGAMPEFDDCQRLAKQAGVPVRAVMAAALAASAPLMSPAKRKTS